MVRGTTGGAVTGTVRVTGLKETVENLRSLVASDGEFVFYLKTGAQQACRPIASTASANAAADGLGLKDLIDRPNPDGRYQRYGRIPNSIFISKPAYTRTEAVVVKVYVKRARGIRPDSAPHANLIERGFTGGGRAKKPKVAGRPFMAPALTQEGPKAVSMLANYLTKQVERLTFPNPPT